MHFPDTSARILYEGNKTRRLQKLSESRERVCDVCEEIDTRAGVCVCVCKCVWTSSRSAFAPSFTLLLSHKASVPFSSAGVLSGGQLVRDTRAIVLTLTVGHWNANREHTKPNGVEEQQIFGQDLFFHWWSRPVYGRWNKGRADGHLEYRAFIWTVLKSNKGDTCRNRKGRRRAGADRPISAH